MSREDLIEVDVHIHAETERAILVSEDGDKSGAVWLPLSQIKVRHLSDDRAEVTMPEWLANDKDLAW